MKNMKFQRGILKERRGPADGLDFVRPGRQNPRYGAVTLGEYRLSYPGATSIPTLTQSGLVGSILARQERKALRAARRRAALERALVMVVDAWNWLRNPFGIPTPRPASAAFHDPTPHRA
ncbi:MAG TPA: hypothetical protein VGM54_19165 [Chthoniobacter sp.]|jgi:hypothetical protein